MWAQQPASLAPAPTWRRIFLPPMNRGWCAAKTYRKIVKWSTDVSTVQPFSIISVLRACTCDGAEEREHRKALLILLHLARTVRTMVWPFLQTTRLLTCVP